jgi:hypothetical protein
MSFILSWLNVLQFSQLFSSSSLRFNQTTKWNIIWMKQFVKWGKYFVWRQYDMFVYVYYSVYTLNHVPEPSSHHGSFILWKAYIHWELRLCLSQLFILPYFVEEHWICWPEAFKHDLHLQKTSLDTLAIFLKCSQFPSEQYLWIFV